MMPSRRVRLLADLLTRLEEYGDDALEGFVAGEREFCPRCGLRARRRTCTPPGDAGPGLVYLVCLVPGCNWKRLRLDGVRARKRALLDQSKSAPSLGPACPL